MHTDFNDIYYSAIRGREFWLHIKKKYNFNNELSCLIIFPTYDLELNNCVINKIDDYARRKFFSNVIILYSDNISIDSVVHPGYQVYFEKTQLNNISDVLQYYRLVQFTKNIVVVSLDAPYGSRGVIGNMGITLADYVENSIFV